MLEIRAVLAELVEKFGMAFAPGEDCPVMFDKLQDVFTSAPGKCELVFSPWA